MRLFFRGAFLFFVVCVLAVNVFSLDREAFCISKYDLDVQIDPGQQRLGVRGKITLRNDSASPQKTAILQISSSLSWLTIRALGKPLEFSSQTYNSDIDHTGLLTEAVITLPEAVSSHREIEVEVAYEGVVPLDATRLTRIDTPEMTARDSDWDQISGAFTALRGIGYVTWYPIATDAASLSQGSDLFDVLSRWKAREAESTMHMKLSVAKLSPANEDEGEKPEVLVNASSCPTSHEVEDRFVADCSYHSLGSVVPTVVIANYETVERRDISVHFLKGHDSAAASYADAAERVTALIAEWFGPPRRKAETADLLAADNAPFESGALLLTSLPGIDPKLMGLMAAHQLTHATFSSARPWINEGLAHFAQALYLEDRKGRKAALDYLVTHQSGFKTEAQTQSPPHSGDEVAHSLINTNDEQLYRSKAMCVWWMLRDMIGDQALKKALASYRPDQDKEPSYLQRLIQAQTQRDLEWFFDDWVYRDRGLPDFKVDSAFTRKMMPEGYMVTVTVSNQGMAGAEVPVTVNYEGGVVTKRLLIRGNSNNVIRVETLKQPEEVVVNDGSVPEKNSRNYTFKIDSAGLAK